MPESEVILFGFSKNFMLLTWFKNYLTNRHKIFCYFCTINKDSVKKLISILTGIILLLAFLWATTGVTVYSHYCSLTDSVNTSLFLEDADCEHHDEEVEVQSCCAEKTSCETNTAGTDCCATQKEVFKLASSYTIPGEEHQVKIIDFKLFECKELQVEEKVILVENYKTLKELPPGNFGKKLVLAIQQQKIAPAHII